MGITPEVWRDLSQVSARKGVFWRALINIAAGGVGAHGEALPEGG